MVSCGGCLEGDEENIQECVKDGALISFPVWGLHSDLALKLCGSLCDKRHLVKVD